jgi:hypothetical protein
LLSAIDEVSRLIDDDERSDVSPFAQFIEITRPRFFDLFGLCGIEIYDRDKLAPIRGWLGLSALSLRAGCAILLRLLVATGHRKVEADNRYSIKRQIMD